LKPKKKHFPESFTSLMGIVGLRPHRPGPAHISTGHFSSPAPGLPPGIFFQNSIKIQNIQKGNVSKNYQNSIFFIS
jgi:hypothetical protein